MIKDSIFETSMVLSQQEISLRPYVQYKKMYFFFKRVSDIAISAIVTAFVLVFLLPILALLIKLESRGPVFFVQKRVGRGGKSFLLYKFRTMIVNPDANKVQAYENDIRITRIGSFLRKCNLDELPQFINVLLGDMSIVGPRPHMHADCEKFSSNIPRYKFRNIVKPGITGLAQSKGFRGPTYDFASMFHRYQFDAFYVRHASFMMDMRIIRKTARQTFNVLAQSMAALFSGNTLVYRRGVTIVIGFLLLLS